MHNHLTATQHGRVRRDRYADQIVHHVRFHMHHCPGATSIAEMPHRGQIAIHTIGFGRNPIERRPRINAIRGVGQHFHRRDRRAQIVRDRRKQCVFQFVCLTRFTRADGLAFELELLNAQLLNFLRAGGGQVNSRLQTRHKLRNDDAGKNESDENVHIEIVRLSKRPNRRHKQPIDRQITCHYQHHRQPSPRFSARTNDQQQIHQHPVRNAQLGRTDNCCKERRDNCVEPQPSRPYQYSSPVETRRGALGHGATNRYPSPGSVTIRRGIDGLGSTFRRRCVMCTRMCTVGSPNSRAHTMSHSCLVDSGLPACKINARNNAHSVGVSRCTSPLRVTRWATRSISIPSMVNCAHERAADD